MVHPDGEIGIARACAKAGIPQCISTNASYPVDEIFAGVPAEHAEDMTFFFQLYVDRNRANSEALLQKVEKLGAKGIFVTVDGPVPGKREADERVKADASIESPMSGQHAGNDAFGSSIARTMGGFIDPSLSWKDIAWLRKSTRLPIVLKGVMTAADAKKAAEMGCDGVVLSNHGGRNLDTSPPPLLVLLEIQKNCPEILDKLEVLVDGGIDRGTDIFKALCLGARAVSMGRGFLWSLNYGQEGVERYIQS
jgi:L-lactate dehydrogenase (cytochrome)